VPTSQVFAARQGTFSKADRLDGMPDTVETLAQALQSRRNDLTGAAIKTARVIGDVLSALEALDDVLFTRLSGSGATCFALFAEEAQATKAADTLRQDHPDWWIAAAPILA